jgi:sialate O-acetylesterase
MKCEIKRQIGYFLSLLLLCSACSQEYRKEIDLEIPWLFEIGDSLQYADPRYDDRHWEKIDVPACWENVGYPGYDGYAWYRIHLHIPNKLQERYLTLRLGRIDDVDEVYVNGKRLNGHGYHQPFFRTGYEMPREYDLPNEHLLFGQMNLIAVRVYDRENCGGIYDGPIGIYSRLKYERLLKIVLLGDWKFAFGDTLTWARPDLDDSDWLELSVPGFWEYQGYVGIDGFGWYRKSVILPEKFSTDSLILALGKINDVDEVFFNGVRIGQTGFMDQERWGDNPQDLIFIERFYPIPGELIQWNEKNIIAVRVFDIRRTGGIWDGPIGIATVKTYQHYIKDGPEEDPFYSIR